jgi:hypothetical protein
MKVEFTFLFSIAVSSFVPTASFPGSTLSGSTSGPDPDSMSLSSISSPQLHETIASVAERLDALRCALKDAYAVLHMAYFSMQIKFTKGVGKKERVETRTPRQLSILYSHAIKQASSSLTPLVILRAGLAATRLYFRKFKRAVGLFVLNRPMGLNAGQLSILRELVKTNLKLKNTMGEQLDLLSAELPSIHESPAPQKQRSSDSLIVSRKPKGRQLSVKELEELSASDIDEETAKEGFIDEDGEVTYYIIDKIVKYEPKRGYYVKWEGYGDAHNTWQSPDSMPVVMKEEMRAARDRYSGPVSTGQSWTRSVVLPGSPLGRAMKVTFRLSSSGEEPSS